VELVGGVRQDFKPASGQSWAAFGIQGTPLYGLELEATAYAGERQQTALRLEAGYAMLLTNRWVLEPTVEANFFGRNDAGREQGSGLAESEVGLRLRYEITRGFAPYVGVSFNRLHGNRADQAREDGEDIGQTRLVAGVRYGSEAERRPCGSGFTRESGNGFTDAFAGKPAPTGPH
jgi:copper resistance protein B